MSMNERYKQLADKRLEQFESNRSPKNLFRWRFVSQAYARYAKLSGTMFYNDNLEGWDIRPPTGKL